MHINSLEKLIGFLSVMKEGSEADPASLKYEDQLTADKENYNIQPVKEEPKSSTDEAEESEIEKEVEEPVKTNSKITPSLDSLIRNINDLRSGESLKRAEIRNEVGEYFDSLSADEQSVLVLFLKELAAVVTKAKPGSEAQDPSDAPEKIIIKKSETESEEVEEKQPQSKEKARSPSNQEIEDDTAPIKVNESQDLRDVRIKFKLLQE